MKSMQTYSKKNPSIFKYTGPDTKTTKNKYCETNSGHHDRSDDIEFISQNFR